MRGAEVGRGAEMKRVLRCRVLRWEDAEIWRGAKMRGC